MAHSAAVSRLVVGPTLYRLDEENIVRPLSATAGLQLLSQGKELGRRLLATQLQDDSAHLMLISTVFTAFDMSDANETPICFETLIFGGRLNGSRWRYATFEQAVNGHERVVSAIASEWSQARLPLLH